MFEWPNVMDRFWSNINKETEKGCWEWTGGLNFSGYGRIYYDKKRVFAHRFSYELHYGKFDTNLVVMHICDNTKCVNPEHLRLGTQADNVYDMVNKNRHVKLKGSDNGFCKLNDEEVKEIKNYLKNYYYGMYRELGRKYNVKYNTISNIHQNITWKHI